MGRESFDSVQLRKRYYQKWGNELKYKLGPYDFEKEARSLIEAAIVNETETRPPLGGKDIMEAFNLSEGPEVGRIVREVYKLFKSRPYTREEILEIVRERWEGETYKHLILLHKKYTLKSLFCMVTTNTKSSLKKKGRKVSPRQFCRLNS